MEGKLGIPIKGSAVFDETTEYLDPGTEGLPGASGGSIRKCLLDRFLREAAQFHMLISREKSSGKRFGACEEVLRWR
jgi:hypothetical protein